MSSETKEPACKPTLVHKTVIIECAKCGIRLTKIRRCKDCQSIYYCSRKCQAEHWKQEHHAMCDPKSIANKRVCARICKALHAISDDAKRACQVLWRHKAAILLQYQGSDRNVKSSYLAEGFSDAILHALAQVIKVELIGPKTHPDCCCVITKSDTDCSWLFRTVSFLDAKGLSFQQDVLLKGARCKHEQS